MPNNHNKRQLRKCLNIACKLLGLIIQPPRSKWGKRLMYGFLGIVAVILLGMYGIAEWYVHSESGAQTLGVSFIPDYATQLGVDPQTTMKALLNAGVRDFRLVSYWNDGEPAKGQYDFSQLDWQFKLAQQYHAKIILTLGLRQPRWPECHKPKWTANESEIQWQPQLQTYMQQVIERYKSSPSLSSYQIENEFFLKGFGNCDGIPGAEDRQRLISEDNLVKELDPAHQIIIGRSNNTLGWPVGKPQPDSFSISIYQRVWDANATHRYLEYPQPSWLYAFIAGWQRIVDHHDMIIGELQAEAWPPHGRDITKTSLDEQNKSMNASRLKDRIGFGKATGMRQIYLWGAEYWYYREVKLHDPSLMQVAQQEFNH